MGSGKSENKHGVGILVNKIWRRRITWTDYIRERAISTSITVNKPQVLLIECILPPLGMCGPPRWKSIQINRETKSKKGQWQQESPAKEYLEQVKCFHNTDCNEPMMKKGFTAFKKWNVGRIYKKPSGKKWAFDRIKEAFDLVAQDEAEKMSFVCKRSCSEVQATCGASSHQSEDRVESQCHTCARTATVSLCKTTFGGSLGERPQSGGAQFVENSTTGGNRTGFRSCKLVKVLSRSRCSKRMRYLRACARAWSMR